MIDIADCENIISFQRSRNSMGKFLYFPQNKFNELKNSSELFFIQKLRFYTTSGIDPGDSIA